MAHVKHVWFQAFVRCVRTVHLVQMGQLKYYLKYIYMKYVLGTSIVMLFALCWTKSLVLSLKSSENYGSFHPPVDIFFNKYLMLKA